MASVGDLFVNVRAKTQGLNSGLKKANRSISSFAGTAAKSLGAIAAGFAIFKTLKKVGGMFFSSLMYKSEEFRSAWANLNNQLVATFGKLAQRWGPALANVLDSLAEKIYSITTAMRLIPWGAIGKGITKKIKTPVSKLGVAQAQGGLPRALAGMMSTTLTKEESGGALLKAIYETLKLLLSDGKDPKPVVIVSGGPA